MQNSKIFIEMTLSFIFTDKIHITNARHTSTTLFQKSDNIKIVTIVSLIIFARITFVT